MTQASPSSASLPVLFVAPKEARDTYPRLRAQAVAAPTVRRPTQEQGMALEILGHAIEYLADSNFYHQRADLPDIREAIALLKQGSREVFAAAPEVLPSGTRAVRWMRSRLRAPGAAAAHRRAAPPSLFLVKRP